MSTINREADVMNWVNAQIEADRALAEAKRTARTGPAVKARDAWRKAAEAQDRVGRFVGRDYAIRQAQGWAARCED